MLRTLAVLPDFKPIERALAAWDCGILYALRPIAERLFITAGLKTIKLKISNSI